MQKKELKEIIKQLYFWFSVFVFCFLWFLIRLPRELKSALLLAEQVWFLSFSYSMIQQLAVPIFVALVGYCYPWFLLHEFALVIVNLTLAWLTF